MLSNTIKCMNYPPRGYHESRVPHAAFPAQNAVHNAVTPSQLTIAVEPLYPYRFILTQTD